MLICLTGETAVGKTVVEKELGKMGLHRALSYTTRPKRSNETNYDDYIFIDNKTFDEMYERGLLYEKTSYVVNGELWQYGLGSESFDAEKVNVVTVNPHGLKQLVQKKDFPFEIKVVYLLADLEERKRRYLERETSEKKHQNLIQRIARDEKDFILDDGVWGSGSKSIFEIRNEKRSIEETAKEILRLVVSTKED